MKFTVTKVAEDGSLACCNCNRKATHKDLGKPYCTQCFAEREAARKLNQIMGSLFRKV